MIHTVAQLAEWCKEHDAKINIGFDKRWQISIIMRDGSMFRGLGILGASDGRSFDELMNGCLKRVLESQKQDVAAPAVSPLGL